jgi:hypothetical protein
MALPLLLASVQPRLATQLNVMSGTKISSAKAVEKRRFELLVNGPAAKKPCCRVLSVSCPA